MQQRSKLPQVYEYTTSTNLQPLTLQFRDLFNTNLNRSMQKGTELICYIKLTCLYNKMLYFIDLDDSFLIIIAPNIDCQCSSEGGTEAGTQKYQISYKPCIYLDSRYSDIFGCSAYLFSFYILDVLRHGSELTLGSQTIFASWICIFIRISFPFPIIASCLVAIG